MPRRRRSIDEDDDDDYVLSARRHAAYCFVDCSARAGVTCRASRDAPRVAPSEWSSRFADRPLLPSASCETKGEKREKRKVPLVRSGSRGYILPLFWSPPRDGVCAARERSDSRQKTCPFKGRPRPELGSRPGALYSHREIRTEDRRPIQFHQFNTRTPTKQRRRRGG